ncbi:family 78 glycoside hydrolase catalytic domain [Yoonia sp. R2331]|uniref:alpha-L-rhamnosidase n=1 Tax=Yoonia sp. R2331 TaxID=3237238 RepID=UPI0034E38ABD
MATEFEADQAPAGAVLHISAQGLYRCFVNGTRVGGDVLTPGWVCYDTRLPFQSYDIGELLVAGTNTIEIWLGDGWHRSQLMWGRDPIFDCWGAQIGAIAEVVQDGKVVVKTDESWRSGLLPILQSGIYHGEDYDARLAQIAPTHAVSLCDFDNGLLTAQECPPVRELPRIPVVETFSDDQGRRVYDFGQNTAGYVAFTVEGEAGARVRVEHAEVLGPNKHFDNRNYRSARAELQYVLAGNGPEHYAPSFTFQGFRYARVTVEGRADVTEICMVPISSVHEAKGSFSCAEPLVNRLVENTLWSQRANFIEVPTDCPQRDERLGWTGDAQVFCGTACYFADSHAFLRKYLRDVMADQRPNGAIAHFSPDPSRLHPGAFRGYFGSTGWGDAITIIPWTLYVHYGDRAVLAECYEAMKRWSGFVWNISDGPIVRPPVGWHDDGFTFGDWVQPVGDNRKPRPTIGDDCAATIYHFITTDLIAKIAKVLGHEDDADAYRQRAELIRASFAEEFITPSGRLAYSDQTSYALAFLHDLIPSQHSAAAKRYFKEAVAISEGTIGTGFIGTPALLPALVKIGENELAAQLFLQTDVPGWLYQVTQGATSIWERWDAMAPDGSIHDPEMNSFNHYAFGAVCQWLFESVAGFQPDPEAPGFAHIRFQPVIIPELGHVQAHHESAAGWVAAEWSIDAGAVTYVVTIPEGATGTFVGTSNQTDLVVDGAPFKADEEVPLSAGQHTLTFKLTD